jgi:RNA polymerase sporulation-specific sigma factor
LRERPRGRLITIRHEATFDDSDETLVERARAGDDRALERLLHRHRNFARSKARTYFLAGADRDDLVQEGMIGLFKAVRDFRGDRTASFKSFAELCIERQIITAVKTATRRKHLPLNSYVSLSGGAAEDDDGKDLAETIAIPGGDPADLIVSAEELASIRGSVRELLSQFEIDVLVLYMDGKSYQEIAGRLGRHVKSVDNALQRTKRKLGEHLRDAGDLV